MAAVQALNELGVDAAPAVDDLKRLLQRDAEPEGRVRAAAALTLAKCGRSGGSGGGGFEASASARRGT